MNTNKIVEVKTDWLEEIDGRTVGEAIAYLLTLDHNHILSFHLNGDTHGCDVVSNLYYNVPLTNSEMLEKIEKYYNKEITIYNSAKQEHIRNNRAVRAESCDRILEGLYEALEVGRKKYNNNKD